MQSLGLLLFPLFNTKNNSMKLLVTPNTIASCGCGKLLLLSKTVAVCWHRALVAVHFYTILVNSTFLCLVCLDLSTSTYWPRIIYIRASLPLPTPQPTSPSNTTPAVNATRFWNFSQSSSMTAEGRLPGSLKKHASGVNPPTYYGCVFILAKFWNLPTISTTITSKFSLNSISWLGYRPTLKVNSQTSL